MKRPRKRGQPAPAAVPKDLAEIAMARLRQDLEGFVTDTATEDPKRFAARMAAVREALDAITQLGLLSGETSIAEDPEATPDELLEAARRALAAEGGA